MRERAVFLTAFMTLLATCTGPQARLVAAQQSTQGDTRPAFDPGAAPKTRTPLAPFLTFGGKVDLDYAFEKDFDLDDARDDNFSLMMPELELALSFDPNPHLQAFLNVELARDVVLRDPRRRERRVQLELKEAYLRFKNLGDGGFSLQVGRQRFKDDREWLYDERLDAVRASYEWDRLEVELSASRYRLVNEDLLDDEQQEPTNNYLLYVRYKLRKKRRIAVYGLFRDDRSGERESPVFLGLHSHGEIVDDLDYWFELAHVRGRDGSRKIRGLGLDSGLTYRFRLPWRPSLTLGYAFGTGDGDREDGVDRRFRQTGFQENEDKFDGVTRFKYYGELADPELSNLLIFTSGIGFRPSKRSSIDLVYHYYLQHKAADNFRGSQIEEDPSGRSRKLGSEIDLVVGYREIEDVDLALILGYFLPGQAFPEADNSFLAKLEIRFSF